MKQAAENYVHGTAAEKLEYNVYEENKVLRAKKKSKQNNNLKLKAVGLILIVFAACFVIIFRYVMITELSYKIDSLNKKYAEIQNEDTRLKVQINEQTDLQKIKLVAETKLGMTKPDKSQIVCVNVPRSDFTRVSDINEAQTQVNSNMFALIRDKVVGFTRLIY